MKRGNRGVFEVRGKTQKMAQGYSLAHMIEAYQTALNEQELYSTDANTENPSDCYMISTMKKKNEAISNPIVDWTDAMVWEYIQKEHIQVNPLYAEGFRRVGCVGCPMSVRAAQEFERFPTYRKLYVRAFQKMIDKRKADGLKTEWTTGEECMQWWLDAGGMGLKPMQSQQRKKEQNGKTD